MVDRDEFAKAALTGLLAAKTSRGDPIHMPQDVQDAFNYADAMMVESANRNASARAGKRLTSQPRPKPPPTQAHDPKVSP